MFSYYIKNILLIIIGCVYVPIIIVLDKLIEYISLLKKENKTNTNEKQKSFYSLAPSIQEEDLKLYKKRIDAMLNEKIQFRGKYVAKNKNIAITGEYATGKSSLVRTYFKNNREVIYVSIASYLEKISQNANTEILEKGILQQILYEISPFNLPLSRISRRDSNRVAYFFSNVVIAFFVLYIFKTINNTFNWELIVATKKIFSLTNILWFIICLFLVYKIRPKLKIDKISIDKIELSKEEEENNESLLNKYVDEIIHAFQFSRYKYVVFEDIDRVKEYNMTLFSRLKDINSLINKALGRGYNKEVQFIYLLSDTIFLKPEDKVKFFDAILDIIPFCNAYTSTDILKRTFGDKISENLLKAVSLELIDQRIIYDVANEFSTMFENYTNKLRYGGNCNSSKVDQEDIDQIFYLSVYKVLYPSRFIKLQTASGPIVYYFSHDFEEDLNEKLQKQNDEALEGLELLYESIVNKRLFNLQSLIEYIKEIIKSSTNNSKISSIKILLESGELLPVNKLAYQELIDCLFSEETRILCNDKSYKLEEIFNNQSLSLEKLKLIARVLNNNDNEKEIKQWYDKTRIDIMRSNPKKISIEEKISCLKGSYKQKEIINLRNESVNYLNSFEEKMLERDVLKNNFSEFLSLSTKESSTHSISDTILIRNIKSNYSINPEIKIANVKFVFDELSTYDFAYNSVCIYDLFKYISTTLAVKNNYYDQYFDNLNNGKILFLIKLDMLHPRIIRKFHLYFNNIWNYLNMPKGLEVLKPKEIYELLFFTIMYGSPNELDNDSYFYNAVVETPNVDSYFEMKYSKNFQDCFSRYKTIKFNRSNFNSKNIHFIELVYKNGLYENNLEFLKNICDIEGIEYADDKLIENIYAIKDFRKEMYEKYIKNICIIFRKYESSKKFYDSSSVIEEYYNEYKDELTSEDLLYIISRESTIIENVEWIPLSIQDNLLKNNRIKPDWVNIFKAFEKNNKTFSEALENYIVKNIDAITAEKVTNELFAGNMIKLFTLKSLDDSSFEKLVCSYEDIRNFNYIPTEFSNKRLSILMNYNLIRLKSDGIDDEETENIYNIINNEEIDSPSKEKFIIINQDVIMNVENLIENTKSIIYYLNLDIKPEHKENLVLKYHDTEYFNSMDVRVKVFNLVKDNIIKVSQNIILDNLIVLDVPIAEKQKLIMNNYVIIEDIIEEVLKKLSNAYNNLIINRRSFIDIGDKEFLEFLYSKGMHIKYAPISNAKHPKKYNVKLD